MVRRRRDKRSSQTVATASAPDLAQTAPLHGARAGQPEANAPRLNHGPEPDWNRVATAQRQRLQRQWRELRKRSADDPQQAQWQTAFTQAAAKLAARRASVPSVQVDDALPIAAQAQALIEAIAKHQVIVVAGETGSGKTTQLPKLCLAAGRGVAGMIGCTQPRRIAAKTVAKRVAQELNCEPGGLIGWQVRFTEAVGERTLIKFMTDGILLSETQSDRALLKYDTLIIDEAHERSLNIDFLLGYLKQLLPKRPDLKLIITSATIDTARFAEHFAGAPIVTVEGRGFPVEIRYRPLAGDEEERHDRALYPGIVNAIEELNRDDARGDVLVFLPGEREIRETAQALEKRNFRETEVVPLYARLAGPEQDRVFNPGLKRRIVLATNVAETSITVPRIRFVIDTGEARISRYSPSSKIERLHIEPIAQASANQRAGRCGRVSAGVCVRLYDEADFAARPAYSDPEILRTSLAGVILRMLKLQLGDPLRFPFLDPPGERAVNDGYQVLLELGATDTSKRLSKIGTEMAELPIDVHYARMLLSARESACLREMLILCSGLSIADPRERPALAREAAQAAHADFADPLSDFAGWLKLWDAYQLQSAELSQNKLRDWAKQHFLSFMRLREWRDLHSQLQKYAIAQGWPINDAPAKLETVHQAILPALLGQVGEHDEKGVYKGTRGRRFQIFPGSGVKGNPRWVMAETLLDTQKVWAMGVARIDPTWIEPVAAHLLKRRHYDPHWDARTGRVYCFEDLTLFGLIVVLKRRAQFESVDPEQTRELFLRHALVRGETEARHRVLHHNAQVRIDAERKEEKLRRRGLLKSESEVAAWFAERVPPEVRSVPALMAWLRSPQGRLQEHLLRLSIADLVTPQAPETVDFPDSFQTGAFSLPVQYVFEPGSANDGATLEVQLGQLGALSEIDLDWLVPGLREEKTVALIKGLPRQLRRYAVPAPDFARAFLDAVAPGEALMHQALATFIARVTGAAISAADFAPADLPEHLKLRLRVLGPAGKELKTGRDLPALKGEFAHAAQAAFTARLGELYNRDSLLSWPFELPTEVRSDDGSLAYPALIDQGSSAGLRAFASLEEAQAQHAQGGLRLLRIHLADELRYWRKHCALSSTAVLSYAVVDSAENLRSEIVEACLLEIASGPATELRTQAQFHQLSVRVRSELGKAVGARTALVEEILLGFGSNRRKLQPPLIGYAKANLDDLREQLDALVYPGFVLETSATRLAQYPRYLKAISLRQERLLKDPAKDQSKLLELLPFWQRVLAEQAKARATGVMHPALEPLRWLVEEFRVSLFAQELRTPEPVSAKRLKLALGALG